MITVFIIILNLCYDITEIRNLINSQLTLSISDSETNNLRHLVDSKITLHVTF